MMMEDDMIINKEKNVQLREMMCEISEIWSACKSQPTKWKLMEASQTLCRNVGRKADEVRW